MSPGILLGSEGAFLIGGGRKTAQLVPLFLDGSFDASDDFVAHETSSLFVALPLQPADAIVALDAVRTTCVQRALLLLVARFEEKLQLSRILKIFF